MPFSVSTFRKLILLSHRSARCAASISLARLASTSAVDPFGRASRMPLSSKVSRIAAIRKLKRGLVEPLAARIKLWPRDDLLVALVDAAAGKHQRAGIEVDLIMADHHEDFDLFPLAVDVAAALSRSSRMVDAGRGADDLRPLGLARRAGLRLQIGAAVDPRHARQQVVDLGLRRCGDGGAGLALGAGGDDAALLQHVFAHRKPGAGLLLVADQRQMGVEQIMRGVALAGLRSLTTSIRSSGKA